MVRPTVMKKCVVTHSTMALRRRGLCEDNRQLLTKCACQTVMLQQLQDGLHIRVHDLHIRVEGLHIRVHRFHRFLEAIHASGQAVHASVQAVHASVQAVHASVQFRYVTLRLEHPSCEGPKLRRHGCAKCINFAVQPVYFPLEVLLQLLSELLSDPRALLIDTILEAFDGSLKLRLAHSSDRLVSMVPGAKRPFRRTLVESWEVLGL